MVSRVTHMLLATLATTIALGCDRGDQIVHPDAEIRTTIARALCAPEAEPEDPCWGSEGEYTMADWDARVADLDATASVIDAELTALAGFSEFNIQGKFLASTVIRSLSTMVLAPVAAIFHTTWHDVRGEYNVNGTTLPLGPYGPVAWFGVSLQTEHVHPLDCSTVETGWVRGESEHGGHWVIEGSVAGFSLNTQLVKGPQQRSDIETCPVDVEVPPDGGGGGGEGGDDGEWWCMVRFWFNSSGDVIASMVLYCWQEQE